MKKSYEMDMCSGPILKKVLSFALPLMLSGILQLLFNAADVIVVGRFAGSQSLGKRKIKEKLKKNMKLKE